MRRMASSSGNAGIGHAIHVLIEQLLLVFRRQIAPVRNTLVEIVRNQIENVFLQICAGAANAMHLILTDHLGQRNTELRRAHRAGQRQKHLAALLRC